MADPDDEAPDAADGDAGDGGDVEARLAALERTVEELRDTVERQHRAISYLALDADLAALETTCPSCGSEAIEVQSGLTWRQVSCPDCGLTEYL
jgi:uncharacterized protein YbbK (DUF523 family)